MSNELQIPEHLRKAVDSSKVGMSDVDSAASSSISVPRVSLRGRTFRFVEGGEEVFKKNDDVEVIILGVEPEAGRMIKTFYENGYQPGSSAPPDCASHDGLAPSGWVSKPQAKTCASCPQNVFGSAKSNITGKPTKRCRDSKQIWILRNGDPKGTSGTQYALNVPVTSLKAFSEFGRKLKSYNLPFSAVITKLIMVDAEYPQLDFDVAGFVTEADIAATLAMSEARPWRFMMPTAAALPMGDNTGGPAVALPGAGLNVPDHIKQATQATAATPPAGDAKSTDSIINNW